MNELNKLSNSLGETLKDSDLQNVSISLVETLSDSLLKDGLFKDIPVIGMIVGLGKTTLKVTELLFLKKIISFLSELNRIDVEKRKEMIERIETSDKYKVKVGEKLLYIIDKCDDYENAQFVSMLFSAFIRGELIYDDFLKGSKLIERIYIGDLKRFVRDQRTVLEPNELTDYEGTGLYEMYTDEVIVTDKDDWKDLSRQYKVEGGITRGYVTDIGKKIRKILREK